MLPDRVSNPGPLTYKSGALPIALCGLAYAVTEIQRGSNQNCTYCHYAMPEIFTFL